MNSCILEIIVLHTTRYGDRDLIIHALAKGRGRCGLIVKNVGRGKMGSALFQPLNCLETTVIHGNGGMFVIREASLCNMLQTIRRDIVKSTISMFMCEVIYRTVRDDFHEDGIYDWFKSVLAVFESMEEGYANFHLYFLVELCRVLGFGPSAEGYSESVRRFSVSHAEYSQEGPLFGEESSRLLYDFLTNDFVRIMALPANRTLRRTFAEDMLGYLCYHTDSRIEIKSLDVLHEVLC